MSAETCVLAPDSRVVRVAFSELQRFQQHVQQALEARDTLMKDLHVQLDPNAGVKPVDNQGNSMKRAMMETLSDMATGVRRVQMSETDAAVHAILMARCCPESSSLPEFAAIQCAEISSSQLVALGGEVLKSNPRLGSEIAAEVLKVLNPDSVMHEPISISSGVEEDECDSWQVLREKYKCLICLDVLAAPHLISCGHSFCGVCIAAHVKNVEEEEFDMQACCPTCREEINKQTLERHYDATIADDVRKLPNSIEKQTWTKRREMCLRKMRRSFARKSHRPLDWNMLGMLEARSTSMMMGIMVLVLIVIVIRRVRLAK
jgi:hypothetical protein